MKRYGFLKKDEVYEALNRLRNALLAARDGKDVEEIINGVFSFDEKVKIGRRVLIAEYIKEGYKWEEISRLLKVGRTTIWSVIRNLEMFPRCFELLEIRKNKVDKEYHNRKYRAVGGSTKVFKTREYTGFRRKDVER